MDKIKQVWFRIIDDNDCRWGSYFYWFIDVDLTLRQVRLSTNARESEIVSMPVNAGLECAQFGVERVQLKWSQVPT